MIDLVRGALKGAAERALVGTGAAARARRRNGDRIAVLAYHDVVAPADAGRGDVSLHLPLDDFRRQLDRLQKTHRIVGLEELGLEELGLEGEGRDRAQEGGPAGGAVEGARGPGGGRREAAANGARRPRAAITFDDAYRGALTHAVPELVRRGLPATVFVCPGLLEEEGFWWDLVADTPAGPAPARRRAALGELRGRQREVLDHWGAGAALPGDYGPADADAVRALALEPGITVASHTWSHPDLTGLGDAELREELVRSREWLAREAGGSFLADHLTFPYGLWNERVAAAAREAGYRVLWRVEGGPAPFVASGGVFPRINIPAGASVRGFELRVSGVLG